MTKEQNKILKKILSWIHEDKIRDIVRTEMNLLPEYFYNVAASSTGKYHPHYCLGDGGLFRHVAAACAIAHEMFNAITKYDFDETDQDIIISALLLHDGYKHGITDSGHTVHEHPKLMADHFHETYTVNAQGMFEVYSFRNIESCIASHMGKWTTSKYSDVTLEAPVTYLENFVHYCDYLASRKFIEVKLEDIFNE